MRTALAGGLVAFLAAATGGLLLRHQLYNAQMQATRAAARAEVDSILTDTISNVRLGGDNGPLPFELVGGNGVLVSSSQALRPYEIGGKPFFPSPGQGGPEALYRRWAATFTSGTASPLAGRSLSALDGTIPASSVTLGTTTDRPGGLQPQDRYRVYVLVTDDTARTSVEQIDPYLLAGIPLAGLLVALAAAIASSLSLRPVEAIRERTEAITATNPTERVPVPLTRDEVQDLAITMNETLNRLETAAAAQRRFIADAAHELRSPIASLLAELDIAQHYPDAIDSRDVVDRAHPLTIRLQLLTEELLLHARTQASPLSRHQNLDLIEIVASAIYDLPPHGLTLIWEPPYIPIGVNGDSNMLRRAISNVLENAIRHAEHQIQITLTAEDSEILLCVYDDGPGIPLADQERVFEPFTRLDEARARDDGGTGLGLAIARDVTRRHGGHLRAVDGLKGKGACLIFTLPRCSL